MSTDAPLPLVGIIPAGGISQRLAPIPCRKEILPVGFYGDPAEGGKPRVVSSYLLEGLHEAGVDERASEALAVYLRDTPTRMQLLEKAIRAADAEQVEAIAHSLKSASGSIRAQPVAELLAQLELAGKSGNLDRGADLMAAVREEYAAVQRVLKSVVDK